jgi:hypothetical protein
MPTLAHFRLRLHRLHLPRRLRLRPRRLRRLRRPRLHLRRLGTRRRRRRRSRTVRPTPRARGARHSGSHPPRPARASAARSTAGRTSFARRRGPIPAWHTPPTPSASTRRTQPATPTPRRRPGAGGSLAPRRTLRYDSRRTARRRRPRSQPAAGASGRSSGKTPLPGLRLSPKRNTMRTCGPCGPPGALAHASRHTHDRGRHRRSGIHRLPPL